MAAAFVAIADAWTEAMRRGDFAAAWRISDAVLLRRIVSRETCVHWPRHLQFIWNGAELARQRVLVRCYHGLGDTLQFARFLAPLREQANEVILWVQPPLLPLLSSVRGVDRLLPLHDGAPEVDYDVDIEIMELGHALRIEPGHLGGSVPYIYEGEADGGRQHRGGKIPAVGLVWRSGDWDARRSIPDTLIGTLIEATPEVQWYSLQYPRPPASPGFSMADLACRDIATMARRMRTLDLIVCVDTMAAHLAGALGVPVWLLLPADCDWRWMRARADSPWYPSMRLFRQRRPDDWRGVVHELIATLASHSAHHPSA